jgi:hypothetical protein
MLNAITQTKTYTELSKLSTFLERFQYLQLNGRVASETFGGSRYLNQSFYTSPEWRQVRQQVILRDDGCDLGIEGHELYHKIFIHHMNPITQEQILNRDPSILNPEFLICVSHITHEAIHYGNEKLIQQPTLERHPGDTSIWA